MEARLTDEIPSLIGSRFKPNLSYFRTVPGIIRIIELVLGILVMICVGSAPTSHLGVGFIHFVSICSILTASIFEILYIFSVPSNLRMVPWFMIEFAASLVWAFFLFVAGCICVTAANNLGGRAHSSYGAGAFFSWVATIVWAVNAFIYFRQYRSARTSENLSGGGGNI